MNGSRINYLWPKMPPVHNRIKSRWVEKMVLRVTARETEKTVTEIALPAHVSRNTIYKWLGRFEKGGIGSLVPQTPGAKTGTQLAAISRAIVGKIIDPVVAPITFHGCWVSLPVGATTTSTDFTGKLKTDSESCLNIFKATRHSLPPKEVPKYLHQQDNFPPNNLPYIFIANQ